MPGDKRSAFLDLPTAQTGASGRADSPPSALERWLLAKLFGLMGQPAIRFVLWDQSTVGPEGANEAVSGLHIPSRRVLWRLLRNPGLNFGDDYSAGLLMIEGELRDFLEAVYGAGGGSPRSGPLGRYAVNRPTWRRPNSLSGSKRNIHHHYDLGNHFYRLWLDADMVYTCAYFPQPQDDLETAQRAKMDLICRKLRLRPGELVIEAGCGWGSLALYMARHYGVRVRAYNISREQLAFARDRAHEQGLDGRVEFIEADYREIGEDAARRGPCDVFVSVGMLEHVGRAHHRGFGGVIDRCLSASGRGLIHSISQPEPRPVNPWLERRIFPGGYPPTLREMAAILEPRRCVVTDVENLRLHYAKTLEHWLARFEDHAKQIAATYDESFVRAWRLYLTASIANFTTNALQLYQITFSRVAQCEVPWTRADLYS